MYSSFLGIDISKQKFDVALLHGEKKCKHKVFANTPEGFSQLLLWLTTALGLASFSELLCVMEATGTYGFALLEFLHAKGVPVSQVNPAAIKAFGCSYLSRTKNDRVDAKLIAQFARERKPPLWQPLPASIQALQSHLRRLEQLQEIWQMEHNRLEVAPVTVKASIQKTLTFIETEIKALKNEVATLINDDPDFKQRSEWLRSIPGVGPTLTPYLLELFGEHHDFESPKQVVAFTGLAPHHHQSGKREGPCLSKIGDSRYRKILYFPAIVAKQCNPVIQAFCECLAAKGMKTKAIICAAMRKLLHIAFGVLKSGRPFDPKIALA